jgi:hypothetical protein
MACWLEGFFSHGEAADCRGTSESSESETAPSSSVDFVAETAPTTPGEALARAEPSQDAVLYLHGPRRAGQTSLLLQFAFTLASADRSVVVVLFGNAERQQEERRDNPIVRLSPCRQCGKPETTGQDSAVWARISIKCGPYTELGNGGRLEMADSVVGCAGTCSRAPSCSSSCARSTWCASRRPRCWSTASTASSRTRGAVGCSVRHEMEC